jgi:hypothetical protein
VFKVIVHMLKPSLFVVRGIDRVFRKVLKSIRSALTKNVAA